MKIAMSCKDKDADFTKGWFYITFFVKWWKDPPKNFYNYFPIEDFTRFCINGIVCTIERDKKLLARSATYM